MYNAAIKWIGSKTCSLAGNVTELVDVHIACTGVESWNMGVIVLGLAAVALAAMVINARRRQHRDSYFV